MPTEVATTKRTIPNQAAAENHKGEDTAMSKDTDSFFGRGSRDGLSLSRLRRINGLNDCESVAGTDLVRQQRRDTVCEIGFASGSGFVSGLSSGSGFDLPDIEFPPDRLSPPFRRGHRTSPEFLHSRPQNKENAGDLFARGRSPPDGQPSSLRFPRTPTSPKRRVSELNVALLTPQLFQGLPTAIGATTSQEVSFHSVLLSGFFVRSLFTTGIGVGLFLHW